MNATPTTPANPSAGQQQTPRKSRPWLEVPIRSLGPAHRDRIRAHLKALDASDRYLRFGYTASDEQIDRYVDGLDFDRDDIFGIYNRKLHLLAIAHLAFSPTDRERACAEFGVSVAKHARGRGYGARLFERAVIHCRNEKVKTLFIHALTENTVMLRIARNAGARVERDGSESEAFLTLPEADFDSRVHELVAEQYAQIDYHLKHQARQFRSLLLGWLPHTSAPIVVKTDEANDTAGAPGHHQPPHRKERAAAPH